MCSMDIVSGPTNMTVDAREQLRITFYRTYRGQAALCSVKVRKGDGGHWLVDVGATGKVDVPQSYQGLPVLVHDSPGAINAVARL